MPPVCFSGTFFAYIAPRSNIQLPDYASFVSYPKGQFCKNTVYIKKRYAVFFVFAPSNAVLHISELRTKKRITLILA